MDVDAVDWIHSSTVRVVSAVRPRKLAKVPFVELADGRVQGVVSSGSDIERVYVSAVTARTHSFTCSTNNNRPCGGLSRWHCKHLQALLDEAVLQYGFERVARYLHVDGPESGSTGNDLRTRMNGQPERAPAATVFARFLHHLSYLELPHTTDPVPELAWFPAGGAVA